MQTPFQDRRDAGRRLATVFPSIEPLEQPIVLALPRGGVPVGYELAQALGVPLDVFVVRKLGVPGREELAMGAIASGDVRVLNPEVISGMDDADSTIEAVTRREYEELARREQLYRGDRPYPDLAGRTVIVVDDGLATGATMRAAVRAIRQFSPKKIIVAVPVSAPETCLYFWSEADEVVCLETPKAFRSVGQFYDDFSQTTDGEVRDLLSSSREAA